MCSVMASVLDLIKHYQHAIEKYPNDEQKILKCIDKLFHLGVTVQHLQETGVGRTVNALRKEPGDVGQAARALVYKWKLMVASEESDQEGDHNNDTTKYNGHDDGDSEDSHRSKYKEEKRSDRSSRDQNSYGHTNGDTSKGKRKYNSSEDDEPDVKKSKSSYPKENGYRIKKESDSKSDRSNSESESDSDSSDSDSDSASSQSESEEERIPTQKIKEEKVDRHHSSKKHSSSHDTYHKSESKSEKVIQPVEKNKHKESLKHSESSSTKERNHSSHRHKSSHESKDTDDSADRKDRKNRDNEKTDKENRSSEKDRSSHRDKNSEKDKKAKYENSSKERSSEKEKIAVEQPSNKQKPLDKEKSNGKERSSDKERKHKEESSSKHVSSSSSSSSKHKSSKSSEKSKGISENSHSKPEKHVSNSDKEKHKSEKDKSKSSSDRAVKEIDEKKDRNKSKDKHSSSSKEKSKDKSSSSKDKSEKRHSSSSDISSKEASKKHKSEKRESSSRKDKHKPSSSKSSSKTSDVPKKTSQTSNGDSDDGIDCGSGASFAEALGMVSPVKAKKKSIKETHSPNSSFNGDLSPASLLAPTAKLAPLPNIEISALPEISPNYKPRPPPKFLPHFEDMDLNTVMSSKNQRTKVYSGNKILGKIPSLYEMCVQVLQEHIDALEYTGGVPYEILKPVVDRATPQQLFMLEHYNPYLMEDTDHLWQKFCEKHFRNKKRMEMETWREMYMRCQEEQEIKLKSLTENIKIAQEAKKAPIKQTKMAYVDSVVKPPRNIARKQAQHGTAFAATASPAARVAALASAPNVLKGGRPAPVTTSSSSPFIKPKKAPLMQKALQFMRGRKR